MTYAIGPAKAIMVGRGLFRSINRSAFGGIVSHHRAFRSTTASSMPVATDIRVSDGEPDSSTIIEQATTLVEKRGWTLCADGKGLERDFRFKTFGKTWKFMDAIVVDIKKRNHHPEWSNVYNKVHIRWTTHRPEGLSNKDVELARICDEKAAEFGEVVEADAEKQS